MKTLRKIISIDEDRCDGCGLCVPSCAEGAIRIVDGKATLVAQKYCDGLGACLGECPRGALKIVEAEAEAFDQAAVVMQSSPKEALPMATEPALACGCPSTMVRTLSPPEPAAKSLRKRKRKPSSASALSHWPVQIRLVPPDAPFLKGADLLVAADCTPVAYPRFHEDFLAGKTVLMGCPKFDDVEAYLNKFVQIFRSASPKSVTILTMEVPCCQGLPVLIGRALALAGVEVPITKVTIGLRGEVLAVNDRRCAA
jgi:Pyruvate/2-oxoacid:ferredoxin oxidoreductase delta subunit